MEFRKASQHSVAELTRLFNAGYTRYFHPLQFTEEQLTRHLRCGPMDLDRSLVLVVDGEPAGFSYLAIQGDRGWIGGFGLAPEFRGRGLSYALMEEHASRFGEWGLAHVQLEVFEQNWARKTYERVGFRSTRRLPLLIGTAPAAGDTLPALRLGDVLPHHARLHAAWPASWNRTPEWLACTFGGDAPALAAGPAECPTAYAVLSPWGERVRLSDAAAGDEAEAARLLSGLGALHPGAPAALVNEPEGSPVHRAVLAAGWVEESAQLEMHWDASEV